jgi:hypothetical protein
MSGVEGMTLGGEWPYLFLRERAGVVGPERESITV